LIEVWHERPPIPTTAFDYGATLSGYDEGEHTGWGPSPEAAIADLLMWLED
jgi:hypothetical protein